MDLEIEIFILTITVTNDNNNQKKKKNKKQNNVLTHESMFYNVKRSQILLIKPQ